MDQTCRRFQGFTLMELLVTLMIVILVAGIAIASMPGLLRAMKRGETRALLTRIEEGLDAFRSDNGYFPQHPDPALPGAGVYPDEIARHGSVILYRDLSGDTNMDGLIDLGGTPYVDRLPSAPVQDGMAAVDSFRTPLRYLSKKPGVAFKDRRTRNPRYDLWSLGGATDPADATSWLTR